MTVRLKPTGARNGQLIYVSDDGVHVVRREMEYGQDYVYRTTENIQSLIVDMDPDKEALYARNGLSE